MSIQEYVPDELNLFSSRPYILSVKESNNHEFSPLNSLDNCNHIEFNVLGFNDR